MADDPKPGVQRRLARDWDDVPATVREDVRAQADDDLRRVELVDRPDGYSVVVHDTPMTLDPDGTIQALGAGDDRMREVLDRTTPLQLSDWAKRRDDHR